MGVINSIKLFFYNMFSVHKNIAGHVGLVPFESRDMCQEIHKWDEIYRSDKGMQFASVIASEVARLATVEFGVEVNGKSNKAKDLENEIYNDLINKIVSREILKDLRKQLEYGCAYGSMLMKPTFDGKKIGIDFLKPNAYIPLEFDNDGNLISVICLEFKVDGKYIYRREEVWTYDNGKYHIQNIAYKSTSYEAEGIKINLSDVYEWKDIDEYVVIENIDKPLFSLFKYPSANNIDIDSPLGVSVFSRSCDSLKKLDNAYDEFCTEVKNSKKILFMDEGLFQTGEPGAEINNNTINIPSIVTLVNMGVDNQPIYEFVPELRDVQYKSCLQMFIDTIAIQCGFDAGYFSFDNNTGGLKTATEVKVDQQRTLATIADIQIELKNDIESLLDNIIYLLKYYGIIPDDFEANYTIKYKDFNIDPNQEQERILKLIEKGIYPKWKYLVMFEGYTEDEAKKLIDSINKAEV